MDEVTRPAPASARDARPAHVLILGCGRSGTSIFGELFEHLPGYRYASEPPFAELTTADLDAPLACKVPRESPGHAPTPGLSFPLEAFDAAVPGPAAIFWQVRHPLDAIASLRVGIARDWGHHPRPPDWRAWLDRPLVARCARHWAYLNTEGYAAVRGRAIVMRFESMIADPAAFARDVCRHVGLDAARCAAEIEGWAVRVQDTDNEHFVEARTSRSYSRRDHRRRVGRWRENLSAGDVAAAWPIVAGAAATFGYTLEDDTP